MPKKSFARLENAVISRHFAAEAAAMTPPPQKFDDSATDADLAERETHQIATAKRAYELHEATAEQIAYLYRLGLIKL